jgi:hypothetical protein
VELNPQVVIMSTPRATCGSLRMNAFDNVAKLSCVAEPDTRDHMCLASSFAYSAVGIRARKLIDGSKFAGRRPENSEIVAESSIS